MTQAATFTFGTKAETLAKLQPLVKTATIPDLVFFTLRDWLAAPDDRLAELQARFRDKTLVVRSSALSEDSATTSMAGKFESILSVPASSLLDLRAAVDQVARSMPGHPLDKILVQEMAQGMQVSGVIMTFDLSRGAPYYCIDFDDETGRTDVVTSGSGAHKSLYIYRGGEPGHIKSSRVAAFLRLAQELEQICVCPALDIEFGMDSRGDLFLFQVRRIVLADNWHPVIERRVARQLEHVERFLEARSQPRAGLAGRRTILAVMPDWNPAEIIGTNPRPLASSLYRELITESVWCRSRAAMGYRDLQNTDLMILIAGHPYIDVRNSFNSFLPAGLSGDTAETLVNAWLDRLEACPELHDKVEFEIVPTCIDFTFESDFHARYPGLLWVEEFHALRDGLTRLTRSALTPGAANTLDDALETSARLARTELPQIADAPYAHLERARSLIESCRDKGTYSFAIAARHAFIAEALLRSAVRMGGLKADRLEQFKRTIVTVSGTMLDDYRKVLAGAQDRGHFFANYGHLRPGTYEITSLRYDERDDLFQEAGEIRPAAAVDTFILTSREESEIDALLSDAGLGVVSAQGLFDYAAKAIAAREKIKFDFTRVLSGAMSHLLRWGNKNGLSRDDLSFLKWRDIADQISVPRLEELDRYFLDQSHAARRDMTEFQTLKFAHIIARPRDIFVATLNRSVPNFVGLGVAQGPVTRLTAQSPSNLSLTGAIVCIDSADPGFDWIFTKGIAALVTRFGGANSHMAVRCAELAIPAAIGCGDQIFDQIAGASQAELNCAERYLRRLHG